MLGPLLWLVFIDQLLYLELPVGSKVYCYADDTLVVSSARGPRKAIGRAERSLRKVIGWLEERDLRVSVDKTEAILHVTRRRWGRRRWKRVLACGSATRECVSPRV